MACCAPRRLFAYLLGVFYLNDIHETMMQRALELARRAEGRTSPNPMVGAVLVKDGRIVGEGFHHQAGAPHAEIEALRAAGEAAHGATLYVNLEPCAHHGRTPPCTQALIGAGVCKVHYAVGDPNPLVNGKGHTQLEAAGIGVHGGLLEEAARKLNLPFYKYITQRRPFVTAKFAMSLDGKIATRSGESLWLTNETSRRRVHELRDVVDAILVGTGTVLADDPQLTTRLDRPDVHHPLRIVADSRGRVPRSAQLFEPSLPGKTVLATTAAVDPAHCAKLKASGVDVWMLPADTHHRVSLPALLNELGRHGLLTLLVEGGSELLGAFFAGGLVDRVWAFVAPLIIGGQDAPTPIGGPGVEKLVQALRLGNIEIETLDGDLCIRGDIPQNWQVTPRRMEFMEA
ncbi:MAG: bifunctional diaminohydroxyphosphoribosylaminopyrimidine deaminase/5-amino-6-(5-phosphoribosylamino)uracil reductase RibD [Anaerolineales bacterium]|nr:bifunctional diaminohydroxyphosphoribosylaminopyrimidine deaminase/5-amino-6-(5-phosphoribosylamino)uracil reductase RibD [Anaerolineales bacterium]